MPGRRILVVDDSAEVRDFLAETILKPEGYQVDEAKDGQDGFETAIRRRPDLVITDHAMPGLTGLEMFRRMVEAGVGAPAILMTAEGSEEVAIQALRAGVADYFVKPFDPTEMLEAVDRLMGRPGPDPSLRLETVFDGLKAPMLVVDPDSRVLMCNRAARLTLLKDPSEVPTQRLLADITDNPTLLDLVKTNPPAASRSEVTLYDGRVFSADISALDGMGSVIALHEVTSFKEDSRAKGDFVATVAHDVRSPLTAILTYIEMLTRIGPLNDQQVTLTRKVAQNVQRITALLSDLLELSRIEAAASSRSLEPVSLAAVARPIIEMMQIKALSRSQSLSIDIPGSPLQVAGNPHRLGQVLTNLIDNAIKYTPEGGQVQVSMAEAEEQVMFSVADTGIGISVEDHQRIFEKFYRVPGVAGSYEGTGLGLSIVKTIVEGHGGRIWVESQPGAGSTFIVVLPAYALPTAA
jgi:signal transduction histidine kinase